MKLQITTFFDCTTTGVVGRYREESVAFQDKSGCWIRTAADWERARNQQRNYETLLQILSLRTQLIHSTPAEKQNDKWCFEVTVDRADALGSNLASLIDDCANVPMIVGLTEIHDLTPTLTIHGPDANCWFFEIG